MSSIRFQQGLQELNIDLPSATQASLLSYLELLAKWNHSYNLTAITEMEVMIIHHLLDSLSLASYVQGPRILDVGTGAGFPGIPLAIALPTYEFVLLDSNSKKLSFIRQALSILKIPNVKLVHSRVESFDDSLGFSDIMARAVSSLSQLIKDSQHLLASGGQWLLMKGIYPAEELNDIQRAYKIERLEV
ncbi:MAG TPA: 16S rRNA (guanine(527)-N(7))-methyltransferase RsmG, partial [Coxiellaceae bacterium]|nr:16S rRNA (guanine(527)-N(7))-methyltransferase RsmG [Coxiellaceae bacterium]